MENEQHAPKNDLLQFAIVLSRWKKFIATTVVGVTVITSVVSLLLPRWYASSVTVLPPKNQNLLSSFGLSSTALMRQLSPFRGLGTLGQSPDIYNYLAVLKSRSLLERVVKKFDLVTVYGVKDSSISDAIEELLSNTDFRVSEEGTLRIEVADKTAEHAAAMANYFAVVLDEINRDLSVREARGNKDFIQERVEKNIADLRQSEDTLKKFQQKHGFVGLTDQNASAASAIAELYSKKMVKEMEVGFLERALGKNNPQLEAANLELSELYAKLKDIPELGTTYLRLYRDFAIQQKLFEILVPLLEQAKIEEKRDTPTLLVLDRAVVAEIPYRPKKRIIVTVFFLIALVTSVSVAFFVEKMRSVQKAWPSDYEDFRKGWLSFKTRRGER